MKIINRIIANKFALITLIIILALVGLSFMKYIYSKGYPITPNLFRNQAKDIEIGMGKEEVITKVKHYTSIIEDDNRIVFVLEPKKNLSFTRTTLYINVYLDENNKVSKIKLSDG